MWGSIGEYIHRTARPRWTVSCRANHTYHTVEKP
jgi:hypothetical protein